MTHALAKVLFALTMLRLILDSGTKVSKAARGFYSELYEWRAFLATGLPKKQL